MWRGELPKNALSLSRFMLSSVGAVCTSYIYAAFPLYFPSVQRRRAIIRQQALTPHSPDVYDGKHPDREQTRAWTARNQHRSRLAKVIKEESFADNQPTISSPTVQQQYAIDDMKQIPSVAPGSLTVLYGPNDAGKRYCMRQAAHALWRNQVPVLYVGAGSAARPGRIVHFKLGIPYHHRLQDYLPAGCVVFIEDSTSGGQTFGTDDLPPRETQKPKAEDNNITPWFKWGAAQYNAYQRRELIGGQCKIGGQCMHCGMELADTSETECQPCRWLLLKICQEIDQKEQDAKEAHYKRVAHEAIKSNGHFHVVLAVSTSFGRRLRNNHTINGLRALYLPSATYDRS